MDYLLEHMRVFDPCPQRRPRPWAMSGDASKNTFKKTATHHITVTVLILVLHSVRNVWDGGTSVFPGMKNRRGGLYFSFHGKRR